MSNNAATATAATSKNGVRRLAFLAVLAAVVIVLQAAVVIPVGPFTITLTLVPIIIGAILFGIGSKVRWMHSVFHIFVVLGSLLQFLTIYLYVL